MSKLYPQNRKVEAGRWSQTIIEVQKLTFLSARFHVYDHFILVIELLEISNFMFNKIWKWKQ
ncbi:hypothetical protein [Neobacillus drentensis]|uniref:hypothetical protein n=1 Tax=Neobacillus drentensis TaxID=220684 RepID=UPI0008249C6F|nr:hypothetical protein [Neobacillus drentensis]